MFPGSAVEWDVNKLGIIKWLNFYEFVYNLLDEDQPNEETIENDDALDYWYIKYRENKEVEKLNRGQKSDSNMQEIVYNTKPLVYAPVEEGKPNMYRMNGKGKMIEIKK